MLEMNRLGKQLRSAEQLFDRGDTSVDPRTGNDLMFHAGYRRLFQVLSYCSNTHHIINVCGRSTERTIHLLENDI